MRITFLLLSFYLFSCNSNSSNEVVATQGIFEFPDMLNVSNEDEIPNYLDPDKILCKGKGIKVARCISKQLKTGICLGILKEDNQVYVVEIDCNEVKEEEKDSSSLDEI